MGGPGSARDPLAKATVGRLLAAGFVLAVIALLVGGGISYLQIGNLLRDRGPVDHAEAVLDIVNDVDRGLTEAETGQRGYVITGQENYLGPYSSALPAIQQDISSLTAMTAKTWSQNPSVVARRRKLIRVAARVSRGRRVRSVLS